MNQHKNDPGTPRENPDLPDFPEDRIEYSEIPEIPSFPEDRIEKGEDIGEIIQDDE